MKAGRQEFAETQSGDHIVFIYKDPAELFAFAVSFIRRGLANGERCAYVVAESSPAEVMDALSAGGVRVDRELKRGALVFTTPREYYGLPPFDATRAIERLREKLTEALDAGFAGLRAAGEMTWAGKRGVADEALGEYEDLLETFLGAGHLTIACLYRRDRFDPVVLQRLVRTHGKVVADHNVYLSLSALFRSLARQDLQGLSQAARERAVRKGGSYFRQGDRATEVYLLTAGLVKLVRTHPDGRSLVLRIVAPAEPFGDRVVAFADSVRLASAEAVQDSRALVWERLHDPSNHAGTSNGRRERNPSAGSARRGRARKSRSVCVVGCAAAAGPPASAARRVGRTKDAPWRRDQRPALAPRSG